MELTNLQLFWRHAAEIRGLSVRIPFSLKLGSGRVIHAEVLLVGYGAENGMLIVRDAGEVIISCSEISSAGYGYSCMSEPVGAEILSDDGLDDLLEDWGEVQS